MDLEKTLRENKEISEDMQLQLDFYN